MDVGDKLDPKKKNMNHFNEEDFWNDVEAGE